MCIRDSEEDVSESESSSSSKGASIDDEEEQHSKREDTEIRNSGSETPDHEPGCSTKGHKRNRKGEAKAVLHVCTHKPYNPHCEVCRRSKAKEAYKARGALNRLKDKYNPKRWGQLITADHMDRSARADVGFDGDKEALVIKDLYSGLKHAHPMATKSADYTAIALAEET